MRKSIQKSFLYKSVYNACMDFIRHNKVKRDYSQWKEHNSQAGVNSTETAVEAKEIKTAINKAVASLPDKCREVYELSRNHSLSYKEISSAMNISTTIANLKVITSPPFYENGMAFFEMIDNKTNKVKVVHIDSISLLLIQKYDVKEVEIKTAKGVKNSIHKRILHKITKQNNLDLHAVKALKSIDETGEYLRQARNSSTSALTHA